MIPGVVGSNRYVADRCDTDAQPAVTSSKSVNSVLVMLVTELDMYCIDLCRSEAAASNIQFVQVVYWTDIDTIIVPVIDACALDARFNAM